ncbi:MAG: CRTAC1 family protein, partial [Verrucomicrobiota bacterium]
ELGTRVFLNEGGGRFTPHGPILNAGRAGTSLALADVDGDGDLDVYVANYRADSIRDHPDRPLRVEMREGRPVVAAYGGVPLTTPELAGRFQLTAAGQVDEQGEPDQLFLNDGRGGFSPVAWDSGAFVDAAGASLKAPPLDWGLSCLLRDLDGDGRPDLYVCNDFGSPDRLWWNRTPPGGPVRFQAADRMALRHTSSFSMGIDAADFDRDGRDDFYVVDMLSPRRARRENQIGNMRGLYLDVGAAEDRPQYSHNTLLRNRGDGTFAEVALQAGVAATEWSWGVAFLDVDLDGWEDLLVTTGHELDAMDADLTAETERRRRGLRTAAEIQGLRRLFPRLALPNVAFRNRRDGTFTDASAAWGFDTVGVAHGMCLADLDGDGDLDVVVNHLNDPAGLYRNNASAPRVAVALRGERGNTRGIGARIRVSGGPVDQSQVMVAGGRYLSSDDPVRAFAAGAASRLTIEVTWPSGRRSVLAGARPG